MPEMDGWQVCERIRAFSDVPILILSALGAPGSVARALDAGADDYLIKPVHASLLATRLRTLVRRRSLAPKLSGGVDPNLRFGSLAGTRGSTLHAAQQPLRSLDSGDDRLAGGGPGSASPPRRARHPGLSRGRVHLVDCVV